MHAAPKPDSYYAGCNRFLLAAVPEKARRILDVGCGQGQLGARLKEMDLGRTVFGIDRDPASAASARERLDQIFELDVQTQDPPLEPGSIDCILYGDVLEHLFAPEEVLERYRRFLAPDGMILCSIPNVQHHSLIAALLKGDFQYTREGLLDSTHVRFFTYSTLIKLLLDAGFAPQIVQDIPVPCPVALRQKLEPVLRHLGLEPERTRRYLDAYQYIVEGKPETSCVLFSEAPLTFVICVSDEGTLKANLLSSPCLGAGSPHEVLLMRDCRSAAEGLNRGLARARHELVVCVHQDVYLPRGWPARLWQQYQRARELYGPIGVLGVYGVRCRGEEVVRVGRVVDRDRLLNDGCRSGEPSRTSGAAGAARLAAPTEGSEFPAPVDTLDELLLAVPREANLSFDPRLGFHFYGADLCLAAGQKSLASAVVDALCFHNSPHVSLPADFHQSGQAFAAKWAARLPLATSCGWMDASGRFREV
jgi:SAM-dependent methyltransferase